MLEPSDARKQPEAANKARLQKKAHAVAAKKQRVAAKKQAAAAQKQHEREIHQPQQPQNAHAVFKGMRTLRLMMTTRIFLLVFTLTTHLTF